ncbi:hypothetical protein F6455_08375 [Proteobacteria bacterium 005FR1]|nr:hypothetical protein [Proteobacteria bacterium 005FR1]
MVLEVLTLIAIILGPIVAVQVSQYLERNRQRRASREQVFKTLMRTRASRLSPARIEALNMIDVEFHGSGKQDKAVVDAWKLYMNSLQDCSASSGPGQRNDLYLELLCKMGCSLGYRMDKTHIGSTCYLPQAHADLEGEERLIRSGLLGLLRGELAVPIQLIPTGEPVEAAQQEPLENASVGAGCEKR